LKKVEEAAPEAFAKEEAGGAVFPRERQK